MRSGLLLLLSFLGVLSLAAFGQSTTVTAEGVWLGTLNLGTGVTLRVQLHLGGGGACTLDSIDQNGFAIPCTDVQQKGDALSLEVPSIKAKLSGNISADGKTLTGRWAQGGNDLPVVMLRQTSAIKSSPENAAADPAMPPVGVADLKVVLDRDLASALTSKDGALAPSKGTGVTIGVVQHGVRQIFSYGVAKPDSVFEIGSITKTFTGLILAQMMEQGTVRLDEPVRELLPPGTVAKPAGAEITLLDLSDQHSGLPRMPDNFHPADVNNPYADYDQKLLYGFIAKQGVALPANAPFGYSNLGVGLLGQALANRAGTDYATLLRQQVTGPLLMHETAIKLTPEMQGRFIAGRDGEGHAAHAWDLDALVGAGGIRSTAADMLTYLEAQLLHADRFPRGDTIEMPQEKTLRAAIATTHVVRAEVDKQHHIALNWFYDDATGTYWHNGATGGYSAIALFNPGKDYGIVVLTNLAPSESHFTDKLGLHIEQRLAGVAALSLASVERNAAHVDAAVLERYVGTYQMTPAFAMVITREGERVFVQATGQGRLEIYPESERDFFLKVVDAQITFEVDAQGKATALVLHQGGRDQRAERVK